MNEYLARRANAEDQCTGRFWEGRFKCQALLDEAGLLTAMTYVDLNPVRAGVAAVPEASEFTSIFSRIEQLKQQGSTLTSEVIGSVQEDAGPPLLPFRDFASTSPVVPFSFVEYLNLVDWTGRAISANRRGAIDEHAPPILNGSASTLMHGGRRCDLRAMFSVGVLVE